MPYARLIIVITSGLEPARDLLLFGAARMNDVATRSEFPRRLKPISFATLYGAAKAVPLQSGSAVLVMCWNSWMLLPLALVCAAMAAPYFLTHGFLAIGLALERGFALVCHQRPERSLWIFGAHVAVCSRCLGIYLGAAFGLLFRMHSRSRYTAVDRRNRTQSARRGDRTVGPAR